MPGEDGFELIRRIRETHADLPVVAMTAFGRPEDRDRMLSAGFNLYLKKPVEPLELATAVGNVLQRPAR